MSPEDRADFQGRCERAVKGLMALAVDTEGSAGYWLRGKASGVVLALSYLREYPQENR